jgi:hypothetical protein
VADAAVLLASGDDDWPLVADVHRADRPGVEAVVDEREFDGS